MQVPELRMSFADRALLAAEIEQSLRCGRAFLSRPSPVPVLSDCVLVLVHPEHGGELRLPAQVVMANEHGTGLSLTTLTAEQLSLLNAFADSLPLTAANDIEPAQQALSPEAAQSKVAAGQVAAPAPVQAQRAGAATEPTPAAAGVQASPQHARRAAAAATEAAEAQAVLRQVGATEPQATLPPEAAAECALTGEDALQSDCDAHSDADCGAEEASDDWLTSLDIPRSEERDLEYSGRKVEQQVESRQERLRRLSPAEQVKVARRGELADRLAVERLYGKQVWEALLQNPRLTIPEVAKIARKGTVPRPLLDIILDNAGWIRADVVRRALLTNPKIGADAVMKLLRITTKHELKLIEKGTAYGAAVREAARKLLRQ